MCFLLVVSLSLAQSKAVSYRTTKRPSCHIFTEILQHPENNIMFQGRTAMFTCEVSSGFTSWAVNGNPTAVLSPQLRSHVDTTFSNTEDENPHYILTIKAGAEYNGTTVQCLINAGYSDQSDNVSLTIQGKYIL